MQEPTPARDRQSGGFIKFAGLSVLLALLLHIVLNMAIKEFPPQNPTLPELQAYLSAQASTWSLVHGLKFVALAGLVFFAAGLYSKTCSVRGIQSGGWGIVGLLGSVIHVTNAMIANGIEILAFYDFNRLSDDPKLFWLLFYLGRVLFTTEIVAWGLFIFGFSMAGFQSAMLPKWVSILGFFSSAACLVSGVFVVSVLTGGRGTIVMSVAEFTGLAWFASAGVYMLLRGKS